MTLLDSATIERVLQELETRNESLPLDELLFYMRKITKELQHIVDMSFIEFWAHIAKLEELRDFLDVYLLNMRKYNDIQKVASDTTFDSSKLSVVSSDSMAAHLKN